VIYSFIEVEKASNSIGTLCKILKVSKSGYYAWRGRTPSERAKADAVLTEHIERIHRDSKETYGAPRIYAELRVSGIRCARKRVARLMREAGLVGCGGRRRYARTTRRGGLEHAPAALDLVKRNFVPEAPDRLWVADITYARSWEGWLYLAFVLDAFSRKVVGWSMANHLRSELVLDALNMAIHNRCPAPGLVHHSDRGSQYRIGAANTLPWSLANGSRRRDYCL
jgi:putative transposase